MNGEVPGGPVPLDPASRDPTRRDPAPRDEARSDDERPPILGSWPRLYAAVLLNLAAMIVLLVWFTRAFR